MLKLLCEKIKSALKKYWKFIAFTIVILLSLIGIDITFNVLKNKKKDKEKEKIIDDNNNIINNIKEKERENEKEINNSNNTYKNLIHGKFRK